MPPDIMEVIAPLMGLGILGAIVLGGLRIVFGGRRGGKELQEEVARLGESLERVEAELRDVRDYTAELAERVEFTERLLARPPESERIEPR
ncbi:MAG TPA: hypothetical protein VFU00_05705 [Gemmatimonadales bacterium]|nr:hypothetical protein [Gemmatimonadales bacterium]